MVDIFRVRVGLSLEALGKEPAGPLDPGKESPDSPGPGDTIQVLVDILIREKPGADGGTAAAVDITTEDGRPFEAALDDVGWDRGKPSGTLALPPGTQLRLSRFVLEVHEMGLAYEHGATYFSVSGAIREKTAPFEGGIWFTRLRGKLAGNPDAPDFQLGGLGLDLEGRGRRRDHGARVLPRSSDFRMGPSSRNKASAAGSSSTSEATSGDSPRTCSGARASRPPGTPRSSSCCSWPCSARSRWAPSNCRASRPCTPPA